MKTSILEKITNNKPVKKIFKSKIGKILRNTLIFRAIEQSVGDWRYPFILFSWWLAKILVPRRKVKINGIEFTLTCTNWITHFRWYLFKTKEPDTINFIDKYLEKNDVFFDIGANVGVFTIYAAKKHKNISVYSFEPEASNLAVLKENIIKNNITERVYMYSVGISDSDGLSKLHIHDFETGAALNTESKNHIDYSAEGKLPVIWSEGIYTVSIDNFCDELNLVPSVIKIDVDGNEGKILLGASTILKHSSLKAIIIEMPDKNYDYCYSKLLESGFIQVKDDSIKTRNQIWFRENILL